MATIVISGNSYDSYATVAEADVYLTPDPNFAVWDALTEDAKGAFLVQATRLLDAQTNWAADYDTFVERLAVPSIVNAAIEIANLFSQGETDFATTGSGSVTVEKRVKAGSVEIENFRSNSFSTYAAGVFPYKVQILINPYLLKFGTVGGFLSYGTDGLSNNRNDYGLRW